jgi:hypothetical protein
MESRRKGVVRVAAVVVLTLALAYLVGLTRLLLAAQRAAEAEARMGADVAALETTVAALETRAATDGSDAAVERWAREERHWTRDGDRPIAPLPAATATATPDGSPDAPAGPLDRLMRWLRGG